MVVTSAEPWPSLPALPTGGRIVPAGALTRRAVDAEVVEEPTFRDRRRFGRDVRQTVELAQGDFAWSSRAGGAGAAPSAPASGYFGAPALARGALVDRYA